MSSIYARTRVDAMPPTSEGCLDRTAAGPAARPPDHAARTGDIEPAVLTLTGRGDHAALRQVFAAIHPLVLA